MKTVFWGFEILASAIDSYILLYFIEHFVEKQKSDKNIARGRLIFFLLLTMCGVFSINDSSFLAEIGTGIVYLSYLFYGFIYINGNKRDIFLAASIAYILLGLINMLVPLGINLVTGISINFMMEMGTSITRIIVVFICKLVYFFAIITILHSLKRSTIKLDKREWGIMASSFITILMIGIVLFVIVRTQSFDEKISVLIIAVNLGLFVILVALYFMILQLNIAHEKQLEYERIMFNQKNQKKLLEDKEKEYEQSQIIRHDIKNYIYTTIGILQKGNNETAIKYFKTILKEKIETIWEIVDVGDATLNAVINTKFTICRKRGIQCETAFLGDIEYMNTVNLGIIMSNLLDNAMEACEKIINDHPRIVISCSNQKGYMDICIKNTIKNSVLIENPFLKTTKKEKELHGYGLKSIKKILDEEGGMISQYEENGWFITHVFLPNKQSKAV